ncbi:MAG: hypothetical protein QOF89_3650 [Acidobacteriota bacterium]|jgi:hypothetical protein|nr:hypothetical protein [Acidobacteriota bacterium]
MVSLDLTLLYLKEGRTADIQRLVEEVVAAFETQDVHREALAASSSSGKPPPGGGHSRLGARAGRLSGECAGKPELGFR